MPVGSVVIYAEDLARLTGWSVRRSRRALRRLWVEHGPTVVSAEPARNGGVRLWTTLASWKSVMPSLKKGGADIYERVDSVEVELSHIRRRLSELEDRKGAASVQKRQGAG